MFISYWDRDARKQHSTITDALVQFVKSDI
jgi:hypothetical protein